MNKKTITLRIDPISKLIMLILGTGVWVMALKPITNSTAHAELSSYDLSNIESKIGWVETALQSIKSSLGNTNLILDDSNSKLDDINRSIRNIPSR